MAPVKSDIYKGGTCIARDITVDFYTVAHLTGPYAIERIGSFELPSRCAIEHDGTYEIRPNCGKTFPVTVNMVDELGNGRLRATFTGHERRRP